MTLTEVQVIATNPGVTETGARQLENKAMHVMNVMSAKAMELSPDITVANVIQRMSGVTVERNSSGEGQYAILRGMDKRYNYTLGMAVAARQTGHDDRHVVAIIGDGAMSGGLALSATAAPSRRRRRTSCSA